MRLFWGFSCVLNPVLNAVQTDTPLEVMVAELVRADGCGQFRRAVFIFYLNPFLVLPSSTTRSPKLSSGRSCS